MDLYEYKYHNYPSSIVRKYNVYTLGDTGNKEGIDKYIFNRDKSYIYNYLNSSRMDRYDQLNMKNIDEEIEKEKSESPLQKSKEIDDNPKEPEKKIDNLDSNDMPVLSEENLFSKNIEKANKKYKKLNLNISQNVYPMSRKYVSPRKYNIENNRRMKFIATGKNSILNPIHHFRIKREENLETEPNVSRSYNFTNNYQDYFLKQCKEKSPEKLKYFQKSNPNNTFMCINVKPIGGKYMGERYNPFNFVVPAKYEQ